MRIHALEITGIGPFRDKQVINFDELSASGLFLIDGPTATGKTTIIDSITYALFSTLSGEESAKDRMRSDYSEGPERSQIVLIFSVNGIRHKITRGIPYSFTKTNGTGETKRAATQSLVRFDTNGEQDFSLTHATEIGSYLTDLLHLNAQQFRQLVVLAQGEFAALLRMNPSDRLKALRDLLGDNFYAQLQSELDQRGKQAELAIERAHSAIRDIAVQIQGMLSDSDPSALHQRVDELVDSQRSDAITITEEVKSHFELMAQNAQSQREVAMSIAEPLHAQLNELTHIQERLGEIIRLDKLVEETREKLGSTERKISLDKVPGFVIATHERIGQLKPLVDWQLAAPERAARRERLQAELNEKEVNCTTLAESIAAYPSSAAELKEEISVATAAVMQVKKLEEQVLIQEKISLLLTELEKAESKNLQLGEQIEQYQSELHTCEHEVTRAELALSQAQRTQLEHRVAVLASELADGEPCAVCGSLEHPRPASSEVGIELISGPELESLESALTTARTRRNDQRIKVDALNSEVSLAKIELATLNGKVSGTSPDDVATVLAQLETDMAIKRDVMEQGERSQGKLKQLDFEFENNSNARALVEQELEISRTQLTEFDAEVNQKKSELAKLIDVNENASHTLTELYASNTRLSGWLDAQREFDSLAKTLSPEIMEIDSHEFSAKFNKVEAEFTQAQEVFKQAEENRTLAVNTAKSVSTLVKKFVKEKKGVEKLSADLAESVTLGAIVSAKSSVNTKKLTLESYALQLRFAHVLESASIHLRKMSSGRLSFLLDEDASGRGNTGLGISVMDESTGDPRPTTSLSGGETFYASLSLALGLADVVQSETGGVSLETLFVDEGFGSLDTETLERVLDQLDQLKSGGRTIGVISHVSEMKDRFPDRIVVSRDVDGPSHIMQT